MLRRRLPIGCLAALLLACLLVSCGAETTQDNTPPTITPTPPPTPASETLQVNGIASSATRLRLTLPSVKLLQQPPPERAQLFIVLAEPKGTYSYLLYPANRAGEATDQLDLSDYPLDLNLTDQPETIVLWIVAVRNTRYLAAEQFGIEALAATLGIGFHNWLANGDPQDDPLAAVVAESEGALFEWFAGIDVLGQNLTVFEDEAAWTRPLASLRSADGGLSAVYALELLTGEVTVANPTATPAQQKPGYRLRVDESFAGGTSRFQWYEGQDGTYTNRLTDGAYEINLTAIEQREFGLSWGSLEGERFENYSVEAQVRLVEEDVVDARYGIWFHYQDDYNFVYFGISNAGEYRVAVIRRNSSRIEIQNWTSHPAIRPGAATNTLSIETGPDGAISLGINGERVASFVDTTFDAGSVALFCYAESVPTTCRLEHLRIWEAVE